MSRYHIYEKLKKEIERTSKTKEEYDKRIKALARKLKL